MTTMKAVVAILAVAFALAAPTAAVFAPAPAPDFPLPGAASTSFVVTADDPLLIRVGIVEEILRITLLSRFGPTFVPWKFSSIIIPDPAVKGLSNALADPAPAAAIKRVTQQWSASAANAGTTLTDGQVDEFLDDVYIQAEVGGPGLNTISGILAPSSKSGTAYGYVASLTQFVPTFGKYKGDNTAYLLGYSIVPANKTATNSATLAF